MTKKIFVALSCVVVAVLMICMSVKDRAVSYKTFQTKLGWGYNILVKNKIVIHQENIPALTEEKGFTTEAQANEAAKIVSKKIAAGKIPSLSMAEVQSILEEK